MTTNYGWICPKCNKVYSPNQAECWTCNAPSYTVTYYPATWGTGVDLSGGSTTNIEGELDVTEG